MPMKLIDIVEQLRGALTGPLPGARAHEPMRAFPSGDIRPVFEHKLPPKPGSVMILLYEENGTIRIPLTRRQDYIGAHGGQVSFPGGKAEAGEDPITTALRECEEEIGVPATDVDVIGRLSDFFVVPSNFMIVPVVGWVKSPPVFVPQVTEVMKIVNAELPALLRDDAVHAGEILAAGKYKMQAPHFLIENEIVWGATAMMLNEFRTLIRESGWWS